LGLASGAVAGLGSITPACGYVGFEAALVIGGVAGVICYLAVLVKDKLGYDDSLDVVGIHGVGGIWGTLCTGLFASKIINPEGANGLLFGDTNQFLVQLVGIVAVLTYSGLMTALLLYAIKFVMGLRVGYEDEELGVDTSAHGEVGYNI
jgi:Amt family ammonium transporter